MSRFVSAGELEKQTKREDEWAKAQKEVDEHKQRKQEAGRQEGGKSLYEALQANQGVYFTRPLRNPGIFRLIT